MKILASLLLMLGIVMTGVGSSYAVEDMPQLDAATLKNGSTIYGEVIEMSGGVLGTCPKFCV